MKKSLTTILIFLIIQIFLPLYSLGRHENDTENSQTLEESLLELEKKIPDTEDEEIPFLEPVKISGAVANSKSESIIIESNIDSCQIYLNSIYQGKTRLTVNNLLPADYILEVRKSGYKSKKYFISAKKSEILTYKVYLEAE